MPFACNFIFFFFLVSFRFNYAHGIVYADRFKSNRTDKLAENMNKTKFTIYWMNSRELNFCLRARAHTFLHIALLSFLHRNEFSLLSLEMAVVQQPVDDGRWEMRKIVDDWNLSMDKVSVFNWSRQFHGIHWNSSMSRRHRRRCRWSEERIFAFVDNCKLSSTRFWECIFN